MECHKPGLVFRNAQTVLISLESNNLLQFLIKIEGALQGVIIDS